MKPPDFYLFFFYSETDSGEKKDRFALFADLNILSGPVGEANFEKFFGFLVNQFLASISLGFSSYLGYIDVVETIFFQIYLSRIAELTAVIIETLTSEHQPRYGKSLKFAQTQ